MAITKAKRSLLTKATRGNNRRVSTRHSDRSKPTQATQPDNRRATDRHHRRTRNREFTHFPQARGKVVKDIEFYSGSGFPALALTFQDDTSLAFDFATGFATEAHFSRWKDGNERVLRYWPRIDCEPIF